MQNRRNEMKFHRAIVLWRDSSSREICVRSADARDASKSWLGFERGVERGRVLDPTNSQDGSRQSANVGLTQYTVQGGESMSSTATG